MSTCPIWVSHNLPPEPSHVHIHVSFFPFTRHHCNFVVMSWTIIPCDIFRIMYNFLPFPAYLTLQVCRRWMDYKYACFPRSLQYARPTGSYGDIVADWLHVAHGVAHDTAYFKVHNLNRLDVYRFEQNDYTLVSSVTWHHGHTENNSTQRIAVNQDGDLCVFCMSVDREVWMIWKISTLTAETKERLLIPEWSGTVDYVMADGNCFIVGSNDIIAYIDPLGRVLFQWNRNGKSHHPMRQMQMDLCGSLLVTLSENGFLTLFDLDRERKKIKPIRAFDVQPVMGRGPYMGIAVCTKLIFIHSKKLHIFNLLGELIFRHQAAFEGPASAKYVCSIRPTQDGKFNYFSTIGTHHMLRDAPFSVSYIQNNFHNVKCVPIQLKEQEDRLCRQKKRRLTCFFCRELSCGTCSSTYSFCKKCKGPTAFFK